MAGEPETLAVLAMLAMLLQVGAQVQYRQYLAKDTVFEKSHRQHRHLAVLLAVAQ
jgi:hypothetical protein